MLTCNGKLAKEIQSYSSDLGKKLCHCRKFFDDTVKLVMMEVWNSEEETVRFDEVTFHKTEKSKRERFRYPVERLLMFRSAF